MTSNDDNADADPGAETAIGPPAADETELLAPTAVAPAAPEAWSAELPVVVEPSRRTWRLTWGVAAAFVGAVALLAGAVGLTAWALRPTGLAPSGSMTTLTQMLPPPPPHTTTVTIQATPPPVASPAPAPAEIPSKDDQFVSHN
jgi:hypothetical protein